METKQESTLYLNILDLCQAGTTQLGPGLRYCIWVQGCPFNCKGCITPQGIPIVPNKMITVDAIAQSILENRNISGITLSGGEPFLQASRLSVLLEQVLTARPELNVLVFTGYKKEQLDWPEALQLIKYVDVLIDGRYIEQYNDNKGLRGSSNQNIFFLTERLLDHKTYFEERQRSLDIFIGNRQATIIGIPNQHISKLL